MTPHMDVTELATRARLTPRAATVVVARGSCREPFTFGAVSRHLSRSNDTAGTQSEEQPFEKRQRKGAGLAMGQFEA